MPTRDETAQRRLVGSATFVTSSGKTQTVPLADPEMPHPKARDCHDIAVLAFPTLVGDRDGLVCRCRRRHCRRLSIRQMGLYPILSNSRLPSPLSFERLSCRRWR